MDDDDKNKDGSSRLAKLTKPCAGGEECADPCQKKKKKKRGSGVRVTLVRIEPPLSDRERERERQANPMDA